MAATWLNQVWKDGVDTYGEGGVIAGSTIGCMVVLCGVLTCCDLLKPPAIYQYKIQVRPPTTAHRWKAFGYSFFNVACILLPGTLNYPTDLLGLNSQAPLPHWTTAFATLLLMVLINDFTAYWAHRWCHSSRWLYKNVHKVHHTFTTPFAVGFIAVHPLEYILGHICASIPIFLLRPHLSIVVLFSLTRVSQGIVEHSGYDFPWDISKYLPFFTDSRFHDAHHSRNTGNYGDITKIWDTLCGTIASGWEEPPAWSMRAKGSMPQQTVVDAGYNPTAGIAVPKAKSA